MTNPRSAYRETDVRGATAVRLVVLLYEQMIQDLRQAAQAIEQNDIELRTNHINHAILVIAYLQSGLDFATGGKVAQDLNDFYDLLRQNLVQVQFFPSQAGIGQQITDLLELRGAWTEVEQAEKSAVATAAGTAVTTTPGTAPSGAASPESDPVRVTWKG
jgi:flagellar secretion chaperone FliS